MTRRLQALRIDLSHALWQEIVPLRSEKALEGLTVWTLSRLVRLQRFLSMCVETAELAPTENAIYTRIGDRLQKIRVAKAYESVERRAAALLNDAELWRRAELERVRNTLLGGEARPVEDLVDEAGALLSFVAFLPRLRDVDAAKVQSHLDAMIRRLWAYVNEHGATTSHSIERRRSAIARLLWAHNERDEHRVSDTPRLLDSWWSLIQEYERLPPVPPRGAARPLHYELNGFTNVLRYARELQVVSRKYRSRGEDKSLSDRIEELAAFAAEVLHARLPSVAAALEFRVTSDVSDESTGESSLSSLVLYLRPLLLYHNLYLRPGIMKHREIAAAYRKLKKKGLKLRKDGSHVPSTAAWKSYADQCENLRDRISRYVDAAESLKGATPVKPFVVLVVGQPGTGKSQFTRAW